MVVFPLVRYSGLGEASRVPNGDEDDLSSHDLILPIDLPPPSSLSHNPSKGRTPKQFHKLDPFETELQRIFEEIQDSTQLDSFVAELEQRQLSEKVFKTTSKTWKWFSRNCTDLCEGIKSGLGFLESMIPENFFDEEHDFSDIAKKINSKLELGNASLKATESTVKFVELQFKQKILKQAKSLIESKEKIAAFLTSDEKEILEKWKKIVKKAEKRLSEEYWSNRLSILKNIIPGAILTLKWYPFLQSYSEKIVKEILRYLASCLKIYFHLKRYLKLEEEIKTFNTWKKGFNVWQEGVSPKVKISKLETQNQLKKIEPEKTIAELIDQAPFYKEDYKAKFLLLIKNCHSSMEAVTQAIKKFHPNFYTDDQSVEAFKIHWNQTREWRTRIFAKYEAYEIRMAKIQYLIDNSSNALQKKALVIEKLLMENRHRYNDIEPTLKDFFKPKFHKKIMEVLNNAHHLAPEEALNKLKELNIPLPFDINIETDFPALLEAIKANPDDYFEAWFYTLHPDSVLKEYIDYQSLMAQTAKHAFIGIMNKKYEWHKNFLYFNRVDIVSNLIFSCLSLGSKILFDFILRNQKTAWIMTSQSILSFAKTSTTFILGRVSNCLNFYFKPMSFWYSTSIDNGKLLLRKLDASGKKYIFTKNRQYLKELVKKLQTNDIPDGECEQTFRAYKAAKIKYEESRKQYVETLKKVEQSESRLDSHSWHDFASFAKLKVKPTDPLGANGFDSLDALETILKNCDFTIMKSLDPHAYNFLKNQMGVDFEQVQEDAKRDPNIMKSTLQKTLTSENSDFIRSQKKMMVAAAAA